MTWFFLSLATAFFAGSADAVTKKILQKNNPFLVASAKPLWGSLLLLPVVFFAPRPTSPMVFWGSIVMALPLEVAGALILQNVLKSSPLSLAIPFMAFTPVFLLGLEWIFLGESPAPQGIAGVFMITLGAYFLSTEKRSFFFFLTAEGWKRQKIPLLMLLVAFFYAITSALCKKALQVSSPYFFTGVYFFLIGLCLLPFVWRLPNERINLIRNPLPFIFLGGLEVFGCLLQFHAFQQVEAAYVIAIKRLSLLLAVFYGWFIFKETGIKSRFFGALLMFIGAIMIALT
jgi:drug/metabolite transporter (DMT)-like permease